MIPPHDAPLPAKFSFWLSLLKDVSVHSDYHTALCPAHDDERHSLSTSIGDKGIVATCHAGCTFPQICSAAGVPPSWMFERTSGKPSKKKAALQETGSWVYRDELGEPVFRTVRLEDGTRNKEGKAKKTFLQQRPDGKGGWVNGVKNVRVVPYRLPDLVYSTDTVLIVEGEKHCDRLSDLGFVATCNAGGAATGNGEGKWKPEHSEFLRGRDVVILPDNDEPGRNHARNVAKSLQEHGVKSVRVCILPELPEKGDIIDWLDAGGTAEQLNELIAAAKPVDEVLPLETDASEKLPPIANHTVVFEGDEPKILPVSISEIVTEITSRSNGFPKRVGQALFVKQGETGISWLQNPAALFGWIGRVDGQPVNFKRQGHLHSQAEVYAELQMSAEEYSAVETLPHFPPIPGHYYVGGDVIPGDGTTLEALVDRYSPESEIDRDLMIAAFATPFWGGPGGKRPIFVITSDAGRGAGKSTLAEHIAAIAGGHVEISPKEDISLIKQRLLSPEGVMKRVAILDNLKSLRFSSAEFEALVTAKTISGKRMYVGEGQRPGTITFILTVNGASFGRDISQRSVMIKIAAPKRSADWSSETLKFIEDNREALIADIAAFLQGPKAPLTRYTRWSDWERDVLCRLPEPDEAQRVIIDRQQISDAEDEEIGLIQEEIESRLRAIGYFPDTDCVHIPSLLMAEWINEITKDRQSTTAITRRLKQGIDEGVITHLRVNKTCKWGRGFIWVSPSTKVIQNVRVDIKSRIEDAKTDRY